MMRPMRRKDRLMPREEALRLLERCTYASLATVGADGVPYVVPMSPAVVGEAVYFHCAMVGHKLDNIRENKNVSLCCAEEVVVLDGEFSVAYESAVAFGTAEIVTDEDECRMALVAISKKYMTVPDEAIDAYIGKYDGHTCVVRMDITGVSGKKRAMPKPE